MARKSRRDKNSVSSGSVGPNQPVKKSDAAPTSRDIAQEAAAIYPDTFATPPTPEEIAAEAYSIYCERGQRGGGELDDWLEAERRLSARRAALGPTTE